MTFRNTVKMIYEQNGNIKKKTKNVKIKGK
jgi:hypothetical protein